MFQGGWRTARTSEVREPPIPHRPRGARSPHDAAALVARGFPWLLCARWPIGHGAQNNQGQPRATKAAASCGYSGPLRCYFPARSVISNDPIVTSACLQVPRDTKRPPGRLEFHLTRVISAVMYLLGHMMYLRRCSTRNTTLFGHHRCESLDCLRCSPSPHQTAGGPIGN